MPKQPFIIAEAGVNHNGDLSLGKKLIDAAAAAGADAVKFQTFRADELVGRNAPKAEYQNRTTDPAETQFEMIRKLELHESHHEVLIAHARQAGIEFLSTPFDVPSIDLLTRRFGLKTIKVPSGEITSGPLLLAVARTAQRVFLSTGMSTLGDVEAALAVLAFGFTAPAVAAPSVAAFEQALGSAGGQAALRERVTLLHCTTEYPAPLNDVNLRAMATMAGAFGLPVGYSDHTPGIHVSLAAVACGACLIEKHFTLDRNLPGPDHRASLEPDELSELVRQAREVATALGDGLKRAVPAEMKNRAIARKSLMAARPIAKGELFSAENLTFKRPGTGLSPMRYWELLGRPATAGLQAGDLIS